MAPPAFPELDDEVLAAISTRHGLRGVVPERMPQIGIFNAIFAVGERVILRVPRAHPRFTDAVRNEAIIVPLARAAGVRTPALLAFDDTCELLPVPYSLYERVEGRMLEGLVTDPATVPAVWRALGADLARLHSGVSKPAVELVVFDEKTDPRPLPDRIASDGWFTATEAQWLTAWLERLAPHATAEVPQVCLHNDTQSANTMVDERTLSYRAVIDWGSCRWGDPAHDLVGVPLRCTPALLEGYRTLAPTEDTFEARILWRHLTIGFHQLRGTPKPDQSWGERPLTFLLDALRFFTEQRDERWRRWGP